MTPRPLLAYFGQISEAPDAIPRLRRFFLDLAVRGKLVPQDPSDEPASELLNRIAKEKARLEKAGEIRTNRPLPPVDDDVDFDVPANWQWTRLGLVASYIQRGKSPKYAVSDGSPVISQKCVQWRGLDLTAARQVTVESLAEYEPIRFLRDGDLLWNSTGTGTIGRVIRLVDPPEKLICDSHVTVVRCLKVDPDYIKIWLRSDHVYALIEDRAAGSTNQVELTAQMAVSQAVPIPPLAEQTRIVARLNELMTLCDQLDAARSERETRRDRLTVASLAPLNAPDPHSFREGARFVVNTLPALTTRPDQIRHLRQTILNLAVSGRLVRQDPKDEPASELLMRIGAEKSRLIKAGELKKGEEVSDLTRSRSCRSLPPGWAATDLQSICMSVTDGDHLPPPKADSGIPFLVIGNVRSQRIEFEGSRFVPRSYYDALDPIRRPKAGDLLYTLVGSYGIPVIVQNDRPFCVQRHIGILRPSKLIDLNFLAHAMASGFVLDQATSVATGIAQKTVSLSGLRKILIDLPPHAEQLRIGDKVNELMALCDQLEASLEAGEEKRHGLLEAILSKALSSGGQSAMRSRP